MAKRDVEEYFLKIVNDYKEMNDTLKELEKCVDEGKIAEANANLPIIRKNIEEMKANYMRISYIMFLLNMPKKKNKKERYVKSEHKRLEAIPKEHTLEGVLEEDRKVINDLKSYTKC